LSEFQGRFASESACAAYLFERRWPQGFVCPGCSEGRAWLLKAEIDLLEARAARLRSHLSS
jgi:Transposase zinc-ribbon domain